MPRRVHATAEQLEDFLSAENSALLDGADVPRLLARASVKIDRWARAGYSVDSDGVPTNVDVAEVLSDATCAQVEQWLEVGEENDVDGLAGTQMSVTGYSGLRAPDLAPRAFEFLLTAGLTQPRVAA